MSIGNGSPYAEPKIGRTLEQARTERGLSLKQVEEATKIRAGYLKELERENFDVLPAVYVQGSLKTYANFLQLDGEALVQELKRLQASRQEPEEPSNVESRKSTFLDRPPIELGGVAVVGSQEATEDEKGAGSTLVPAGINRYLYLIPGAFLVLALTAVALAFIPAGDRQPAVSQVREPLISEAPRESSPVSSEKVERSPQPQHKDDKQGADDRGDGPQLEQPAAAPDAYTDDVLAGQTVQAWQDQGASPRPAQDPRGATATPSASPTAETTPPATAEPDDTPTTPTTEQDTATTPPSTEPDTATTPPATEAPAQRRSEASPPPTAGPGLTSPGSRGSGDFDVEVLISAERSKAMDNGLHEEDTIVVEPGYRLARGSSPQSLGDQNSRGLEPEGDSSGFGRHRGSAEPVDEARPREGGGMEALRKRTSPGVPPRLSKEQSGTIDERTFLAQGEPRHTDFGEERCGAARG